MPIFLRFSWFSKMRNMMFFTKNHVDFHKNGNLDVPNNKTGSRHRWFHLQICFGRLKRHINEKRHVFCEKHDFLKPVRIKKIALNRQISTLKSCLNNQKLCKTCFSHYLAYFCVITARSMSFYGKKLYFS